MFTTYLSVFLKAIFTFIVLLILTRLMGRKQLVQLTTFDYVVRITIGSIAAAFIINRDVSVVDAVIAVVTLTALSIAISYLEFFNLKAHKILEGKPVIIIDKGKLIYKNMKKVRYNIEDLLMQLRIKDIFDINEVYYAIVESEGQLTVIKKAQFRNTRTEDFNLQLENEEISVELIMNGKVIYDNLKKINKTEKWLINKIHIKNLKDDSKLKTIILAYLDSKNNVHVLYKTNMLTTQSRYDILNQK